jgi:putative transposase
MAPSQKPSLTRLEELALFRHAIVGDLVIADQPKGTINAELRDRAERRCRPPGASASRTYQSKTFQRWLFAARRGLQELQPAARQRGFCLALPSDVKELLLDIRRQHMSASTELILNAAIQHGVLEQGDVSLPTLRRMYARAGIPRQSAHRHARAKDRRRWEVDRVCQLWHADVCHVWLREPGGSTRNVYIHGILDDRSRYIISLVAREAETENDLLEPLVEALARYLFS